jgi:hypothetical protein
MRDQGRPSDLHERLASADPPSLAPGEDRPKDDIVSQDRQSLLDNNHPRRCGRILGRAPRRRSARRARHVDKQRAEAFSLPPFAPTPQHRLKI